MKTLILYAGKYGAAREIAHRISKNIHSSTIHDLKQKNIPALDQYDCVIIGSSIYAGTIRKDAKVFVTKNAAALQSKKLGLFLSGLDASREQAYFESNFSADILRTAKAKNFLGGVFDPQKANAFERFVIKTISKQTGYMSNILDEKIERFAAELLN